MPSSYPYPRLDGGPGLYGQPCQPTLVALRGKTKEFDNSFSEIRVEPARFAARSAQAIVAAVEKSGAVAGSAETTGVAGTSGTESGSSSGDGSKEKSNQNGSNTNTNNTTTNVTDPSNSNNTNINSNNSNVPAEVVPNVILPIRTPADAERELEGCAPGAWILYAQRKGAEEQEQGEHHHEGVPVSVIGSISNSSQ
jgi:hypothetical protein